MPSTETNDSYFADYDGLQNAKHQLLRRYLGGWFPILASSSGRVLFVDCCAGRGRHETGHEGSPILALRTLLQHDMRPQILAQSEVWFHFFEANSENYACLQEQIRCLGKMPDRVNVRSYDRDYAIALRQVIDELQQHDQQLGPALAFLDPYGFKLSMSLLNDLLSFPKCELLISFMYHWVDIAMHNAAQASNLDTLFGCAAWRDVAAIGDPNRRADATVGLFSQQLKAQFATHMCMRSANGTLKYALIHATNHRRGREVMREAMWSVAPDGSFTAFERDNPNQLVLIAPNPDLHPLKSKLWHRFAGQQVRMQQLYDWLLGELYLQKHLHDVLREYRDKRIVQFSDYGDRFAFGRNPVVSFPSKRPISDS